jgi:hypothetical protein
MSEHEEKLGDFEEQLAGALKRVAAPTGLMRSVMLAVEADESRKQTWWTRIFDFPRIPDWAFGAVAATVIVGALVGGQMHERREHVRVEAQQRAEANREFETANRITDRALDHVRQQLAKAGVAPED